MSDFYDNMGALAVNKIRQYGKPITITQNVLDPVWNKVMNTATRKYEWRNTQSGAISLVDPTVALATPGFGLQDRYKGLPIPGLTIEVGDIRLWAVGRAVGTFPTPHVGDLITMNGKTKTVVSANPVQPGDLVLMWDIQLR